MKDPEHARVVAAELVPNWPNSSCGDFTHSRVMICRKRTPVPNTAILATPGSAITVEDYTEPGA